MGKKKKKSRASTDGDSSVGGGAHTPGRPPPSPGLATLGAPKHNRVVDCLPLVVSTTTKKSSSLLHTGSNNLSFQQRYTPIVTLNESDAQRLNVEPLDPVFVLPRRSTPQSPNDSSTAPVMACSIARVHVWTDSPNDPSSTTPSRVSSPLMGKKKPNLMPGQIQLHPPAFLDFLWKTKNDDDDDDLEKGDTSIATPSTSDSPTKTTQVDAATETPTTPQYTIEDSRNKNKSSGKSSFSFNNFVDEHNLSTPSPSRTTNRNSTDRASSLHNRGHRQMAWIVPVDSDLGDCIWPQHSMTSPQHSKAGVASTTIGLQVLRDNNSGGPSSIIPTSAHRILERLIKATHIGRWVQVGEPISTSFQGKTLNLQVVEVASNITKDTSSDPSSSMESLQQKLGHMKLEQDDNASTDGDAVMNEAAQIIADMKALHIQIHQITENTKIQLVDPSDLSDKSVVEDKGADESLPPQQFVAGLSSVVQHVREHLLIPLTRPELFSHSQHISPPRGVLLHGPSGAGKTCLAKQIASDLAQYSSKKCVVEFVNCVSLQSKTAIVGQAERSLSQHFRSTPDSSPKLLIFDDIHLICSKRGGTGSTDQLAATLLALLDGVGRKSNKPHSGEGGTSPIAILAITNDATSLDPALRRPGRLDFEVEVPLPDEPSQRADILRFHMNQMGIDKSELSDEDTVELAKMAKGFNGADCLLAVKEAVRLCIKRDATANMPLALTKQDLTRAIKSIRPSAIKAVTVEIPQVLWSDIGGMESVKSQLREAIELPLTQHELYQKLRIPPPRGILLYGPPGTGKTMIARALATEGKMNFLAVKGPELLSKWLGESERALASLFRRARMASPSIIFFDEIDAIAAKRGSSDSSSGSRMLSQLLTELDGVVTTGNSEQDRKKQRVVVVGATNRPDLLDSALTRPGRIDRMVYVGLPDQPSREKVFEVALKGRSCDPNVDLTQLSDDDLSGGFSGAELVSICREAALLALDECIDNYINTSETNPSIKMNHLVAAVKSTKKQISPEMLGFYASFRDGG